MADHLPLLALGLMSGTSCDGVDVALIETDGEQSIRFLAGDTVPYQRTTTERLLEVARRDIPLNHLLRLERDLTQDHADAVRQVLAEHDPPREIEIVGFPGHTIRHLSAELLSWQLGDASLLAEELGIPVVADFRRRDLAAGGEGAPLAPLYHQALLLHVDKPCLVLNLGGVANITWLGLGGQTMATDTGPGCGLLDAWTFAETGFPFDRDGQLAIAGRIDVSRVRAALTWPFFEKLLPKSADRHEFDDAIDLEGLNPADGAATLCEFTVEAVLHTMEHLPAIPRTVWVTGGGAKHPYLMQRLAARFAFIGVEVGNIRQLGLRPDLLEAECFAWLAVRRLRGLPLSLPTTTGCRHATVGGVLTM
ncbi:MAG: anhydro-N-acetylmuramic acid kinase [Pirellulales bacterium]|nr:anhydro-N-acetylmuramic acid kinase [Pirellulales bacterium]